MHNKSCVYLRHGSCCRWKYRAGFVMWPRQNRWPVFCRQGVSAAYTKLTQLIASHQVLLAQTTAALPAPAADGDVSMLPSEASQAEQELVACKEDISSLIQAMYSHLRSELVRDNGSGYERFGDIAVTFELPLVYEGLLNFRLKVCKLTLLVLVCEICCSRLIPFGHSMSSCVY